MNADLYARVKEVFAQAVKLKPAKRDGFLDGACDGDKRLREEVESLLAHHNDQTILPDVTTHWEPATTTTIQPKLRDVSRRSFGRAAVATSGEALTHLFGDRWRRVVALLVTCLLLFVLGYVVLVCVHGSMKSRLKAELATILKADVEALEIWFRFQKSTAESFAEDHEIRKLVANLVSLGNEPDGVLLQSDEMRLIREGLRPKLAAHRYGDFVVIDANLRIVAANNDAVVGNRELAKGAPEIRQILDGKRSTWVTLPFESATLLPAVDGRPRAGLPTMFAVAPIKDVDEQVIAVLGLRINPVEDFTPILQVARAGNSGETYAFDKNGVLISESRFEEQLKEIGLIPHQAHAHSILNVEIRDPGVDMTVGRRPKLARAKQPLTRMAESAIAHHSGIDVDGYRDYRGVKVIGAWTWLDKYDFGVTTEIDVSEAFAPMRYLDIAFGSLFVVLAGAVLAALLFSFVVVRLRREVREAKRLGNYTLGKQIGEGGMGQVYLAYHELLKRPTAVKLLKGEQASKEAVTRFEREVQVASRLTHVNTIEIYDFGHTDDGVFYYAMEFVDGPTLEDLIEEHGALSPSRSVYILRQVCGSLREAHGIGLIHRDIKTLNIMLCERGGEYDFVKVLDFGLVKEINNPDAAELTGAFGIMGSPLYMSPERIRDPLAVDVRADIYSLGVVAFNLLTGCQPFKSTSMVKLFGEVLNDAPPRVSDLVKLHIPPALDQLVDDCMAKSPEDRPQTVSEVLEVLNGELGLPPWTQQDAKDWWESRAADATPSRNASTDN